MIVQPASPDHRADDLEFRSRGAKVLLSLLALGDLTLILSSIAISNHRALMGQIPALLMVIPGIWFIRKGRPEWTSHTVLFSVWAASTGLASTGPGVFGAATDLLVILPLLGGLFCRMRGLVIWSVMGAASLTAIYLTHRSGLIVDPTAQLPSFAPRTLTFMVMLAMVTATTVTFLRMHATAVNRLVASLSRLAAENEERQRAEVSARVAAETQARFLATMSHELRSPLNGVICAARLIDDSRSPQQQAQLVGTLVDSAEGLLALISDILDYSRLEQDSFDVEELPIDLRQVVERTTMGLRLLADQRDLRLTVDIKDDVPKTISGDPRRIAQVLFNIVGNALKFTEKGRVEVVVRRVDDTLELKVTDTGIGIPANQIEHLFNPFTQADASTNRRFGGSGLGLAISRRLALTMGGDIRVSSSLHQGSVFTFLLPCNEVEAPSLAEITASPPVSRLSILVVDDNIVNRSLQTMLLEKWGHVPMSVDGGGEAVAAVLSGDFDMVLMDCQMPGVDGYMATQLIRRGTTKQRSTWIVGLSADARLEARKQALAAGMDDFITKPLRPEDFKGVLERHPGPSR